MGSRRTRARMVASSIVIVSLITSLTYAFVVTEGTPTSSLIPGSVPGRIVFSIRNNGTSALQVSSINIATPTPTQCTAYTNAKALASNFNDMIAPGRQQQFYVDTGMNGINPAMQGSCPYDVVTSAGTQSLTINFTATSGSPTPVDVQPRVMSFGSQFFGSSEDQHVYVTNYTSATLMGYRVQLSGSGFSFQGSCVGQTCMPPAILQNNYQDLIVRCTPMMPGISNGTLVVFGSGSGSGSGSGGMMLGSDTLSCTGTFPPPQINIVEDPIQIVTPVASTGSAAVTIDNIGSGGESLQTLTLSGSSSFGFTDTVHCSGQTCTFTPGILLGQTTIYVTCTPPDATPLTAQLTAQGSASSDTAQVTCQGTTMSGPQMVVSPMSITVPTLIPVNGSSGPYTVMVKNLGDQTLQNVQVSIVGAGSADWQSVNCGTTPCNIGSNTEQDVLVTFAPHTHGDRHATLHVAASNFSPPADVELYGTATGGVLAIAPLDIAFGTLPRNQLSQHDAIATNEGNSPIFVTFTTVPSPFSIGSDAVNGFGLSGGEMRTFKVGCGSAVAASYDSSIAVVAPQAYVGSNQAIHVNCTVAPTDIKVTPTDYDFGEVFRGTAAVTKNIEISNPTTAPIDVTRVAITGSRPGLSLTVDFSATMTVAPGAKLLAALTLNPTDETDLAGVNFEIDVQNTTLSYPVTGKVVTPHSYVTPYPNLDLGTACVGTQVRGSEMLINDGTATLLVGAPVMDQAFSTMFTSPSTYPTNLAPGGHANVQLIPSTSTSGPLHGTLTWDDSVPSHYAVDVDLTYVSDGPALSPRALAFGTVAIDTTSPEQTITLENCGLQPVTVKVLDVVTTKGRADAWVITPGNGYAKTLGTHDRLTITAAFSPHHTGHFDAQLRLDVNSAMQTVALVGDATGLDSGKTSFYSCSGCSGQGGPVRGWPIIGAIVFVIVRRRNRR